MKPVILECITCDELYTEIDVENFRFFPSTGVCYNCYRAMQKADTSISCFGKQYDALANECRELCPDRKLCPSFANKKFIKLRQLAEKETEEIQTNKLTIRQYPFRPTSLLCKAFKLCIKGTTITELKRWCKHRGKNYSWVIATLRRGYSKNGRKWKLNEKQNSIQLEYPIQR